VHPEFLREMTAQRQHEMQTRAHQNRLAQLAIRVGRRGRNRPEADGFVIPPIPDYVDGSFRTEPASSGSAAAQTASGTGQAAPARRAA
jgi:hypothetical protein